MVVPSERGMWVYLTIYSRGDIVKEITADRDAKLHVLEIGCGMGGTAALIKTIFPECVYAGIEIYKKAAEYARAFRGRDS